MTALSTFAWSRLLIAIGIAGLVAFVSIMAPTVFRWWDRHAR